MHFPHEAAMPLTPSTTRRRLLAGAAWSVPAITLATASPSFATSVCTVGPVPVSPITWTLASGALARWDAQYTGWLPADVSQDLAVDNPAFGTTTNRPANSSYLSFGAEYDGGFASGSDGGVPNVTTVIAVSYSFDTIADATYQWSLPLRWGHANNGVKTPQGLVVSPGPGATDLAYTTVDYGGVGLPGHTSLATLGGDSTNLVMSGSFTATTSGRSTFRMTFTLPAVPITWGDADTNRWVPNAGRSVHDDINVGKPQITLASCA